MKKLTLIIITAFCCTISIAQTTKVEVDNTVKLENLKREDYLITETIEGVSRSNRFWILFIPIGGKSEEKRKAQSYKRALQECKCDGLIQPQYQERKILIPLILVTFSHRKTKVSGKGYTIKTDTK